MKIQQQSSKETKNRGGDVSSPEPILNARTSWGRDVPTPAALLALPIALLMFLPIAGFAARVENLPLLTPDVTAYQVSSHTEIDPTRAGVLFASPERPWPKTRKSPLPK